MFCIKCGADLGPNSPAVCPQCGAAQSSTPAHTELPMKWFKFVIYVQLFANALVSAVNVYSYLSGGFVVGLTGLTGRATGSEGLIPTDLAADIIYSEFPSLWPLVVFLSVLSIGMAIWSIVVRQWLAHYQWRGVQGLYILYVLAIATNLIMILGLGVVLHSFAVGLASTAPMMIGQVVLLVLNTIYFNKRRHLFH